MRKLILILFITTNTLFAQQISVGNTTLNRGAKGDKGDLPTGSEIVTALDSELGGTTWQTGGSSSNILERVVSQASNFTGDQSAHANKEWHYSTTIDLGGATITLPTGVTLVAEKGGKLTNYTAINGALSTWYCKDPLQSIVDASGTIGGNWKQSYLSGNWIGLVDDDTEQGTDNRQAFKNIAAIANSSGNISVNIHEGTYWYSPSTWYNLEALSDNITINGNDNIHWIGHKTKIKTLTHNYSRSTVFHLSNTNNSSVEGFEIIGDIETHPYTSPSTEGLTGTLHEHNMAIMLSNNANNCIIKRNKLSHFTADGIYFKIKVYVGSTSLTDASFEDGTIDKGTGANAVDTDFERTINFIDLTDAQFQDNLHFSLDINTGGKLDKRYYTAYFYDAVGTFIEASDRLEIFDRVYIKSTYKQMKLVIYDNTSPKEFKVINYEYPFKTIIEHNEIFENERQGISNPSIGTIIRYNFIHDIGSSRQFAGPAGGIDVEDGLRNNYDVEAYGNIFKNNAGADIILKFSRYISIHDNIFDYDDRPNWSLAGSNTSISHTALDADYAEHSKFYNNTIKDKNITASWGMAVYNNTWIGGNLNMHNSDTKYYKNDATNITFTRQTGYTYPGKGTVSGYFNYDTNTKHIGKVFADNNTFDFVDAIFEFNNLSDDQNIMTILDTTIEQEGIIDGMEIRGYTGSNFNGYQPHSVDISNSDYSCPIKVQFCYEKSFTWENVIVSNWIDLDLRNFTSGTETIYLRNVTLNVDDTNVLVGNYPLSAKAFDFDIVMIDCKINFNFNVTKTFQFLNTGSLYMDNCTITAANAETYDFTSASLSNSTLVNCKTKNFTFSNATSQTGTVVLP